MKKILFLFFLIIPFLITFPVQAKTYCVSNPPSDCGHFGCGSCSLSESWDEANQCYHWSCNPSCPSGTHDACTSSCSACPNGNSVSCPAVYPTPTPSHNHCQGCDCITVAGVGNNECSDGSKCACSTPVPPTATPTSTRIPTATPTNTSIPTRTPTPTSTPTLIPCDGICGSMSDCGDPTGAGFRTECTRNTPRCVAGKRCLSAVVAGVTVDWVCRNPVCPDSMDCACRTTPTPTITPTKTNTPTPTKTLTPTPTLIVANCSMVFVEKYNPPSASGPASWTISNLDNIQIGDKLRFTVGYSGPVTNAAIRIKRVLNGTENVVILYAGSGVPTGLSWRTPEYTVSQAGEYEISGYIYVNGAWK